MDLHKEIKRCREDFGYFCTKYLKIVTKDSKLAPLALNKAQVAILDGVELDNNRMLLKARQLGSTTAIAARFSGMRCSIRTRVWLLWLILTRR